ncbi:uncharacterized protein DEA37_0011860 [Paragonimus westermani]|uniref:TFIIS N-terminal domain-containing protein n=1 Tax=Paragonimus westermani TaxID=34504 RepID=A0A5J4NNY3_9TREM|nr:uncharacterized protein DEA37_0011860 [Paragonimus westermani]
MSLTKGTVARAAAHLNSDVDYPRRKHYYEVQQILKEDWAEELEMVWIQIKNKDAVVDAVGQLETFPMTMSQLQDTRIGQLLQTIRHKVDAPLQKRIRSVIKAWQKLLSPEFASLSVIPLKCTESAVHPSVLSTKADVRNTFTTPTKVLNRENSRNVSQRFVTSFVSSDLPVDQRNSPSGTFPEVTPRPLKRGYSSSTDLSDTFIHNQSPAASNSSELPPSTKVTPPSKRLKPHAIESPQVSLSSSKSQSQTVPASLVNGGRHTDTAVNIQNAVRSTNSFLGKSNVSAIPPRNLCDKSHTPATPSKEDKSYIAMRLAKVKSTAELVQAAGDCIDSATADRILTNQICKEADPPRPSIVSQLIKPRHVKAIPALTPGRTVSQSRGLCSTAPRPSIPTHPVEHSLSMPAFTEKSGSKAETTNKNVVASKCCTEATSTYSPPVWRNAGEPSLSTNGKSRVPTRPNQASDVERTLVDTDSDTQKCKEKNRKKKHKHRHKHYHPDETIHRVDRHSTVNTPPVTNHLDDWPTLPPLPKRIDWHSLEGSVSQTNEKGSHDNNNLVNHLLFGEWPGVNRTFDDEGNLRLPTELYSLTIDDQYLHVLPWVDLVGSKRQFFPPSSTQDLDQLTDLPEPW